VILVQRAVDCKLNIKRVINNKEEISVDVGRGYYKEDNDEKIVFFTSSGVKYKYIYNGDSLIVYCNDSKYVFKCETKEKGIIKNGEYTFILTTLASKIEFNDNSIILEYSLYQNDLIGTYYTSLSFN
jgi:hypothetical protein